MNYFHIKISRQWSQNGLLSPVRNAILFFFFGGGGGGGGRRGRRKNNAKYGEMLRVGLSPLRWKRPQNSALKM